MHTHLVPELSAVTTLSKELRTNLDTWATIQTPQVVHRQTSVDGTQKYLLGLSDGRKVEAVLMPDGADRATLCISSQVGCSVGCPFCHTGRQAAARSLVAAELVGQVRTAQREHAVSNVVFMGEGEPLAAYTALVPALRILTSTGLSPRRVTVSTSGVAPKIRRLAHDCPVSLAVSLHAPRDTLRDVLVPLNRTHNIAALLDACADYPQGPYRRIAFEYVMLKGINDTDDDADQLVALLRKPNFFAYVNLIPFNPWPGAPYQGSSDARVRQFCERLLAAGLDASIRHTRGGDIMAACGQLRAALNSEPVTTAPIMAVVHGPAPAKSPPAQPQPTNQQSAKQQSEEPAATPPSHVQSPLKPPLSLDSLASNPVVTAFSEPNLNVANADNLTGGPPAVHPPESARPRPEAA